MPPNNKNTQPGGKIPTPGAGREARGPGPQRRRQPERSAERAAPARLPPGELSAIGRAGCIKLLAINKARVRLCKAQILICKVLKIFKWKDERGAGGRAGAARGEGGREGGRAARRRAERRRLPAARPPGCAALPCLTAAPIGRRRCLRHARQLHGSEGMAEEEPPPPTLPPLPLPLPRPLAACCWRCSGRCSSPELPARAQARAIPGSHLVPMATPGPRMLRERERERESEGGREGEGEGGERRGHGGRERPETHRDTEIHRDRETQRY